MMDCNFSPLNPAFPGGAAHAWSCRLWPDPFEAPEVPPADILQRLFANPDQDPDLLVQIEGSATCARAVAALKARELLFGQLEKVKPLKPLREQLCPAAVPESPPAFGEIWRTRMVVEGFDGEKIVPRKTWSPPLAFITGEPQSVGFDTVCRAMLCSLRELCDDEIAAVDADIIRLESGHEFVVHFAFEYPVSLSQLEVCLGTIDPFEGAALQEKIAAFSMPEEESGAAADQLSPAVATGLERLAEFGAWLASNAEARLDRQNASVAIENSSGTNPRLEVALFPGLVREFGFEDLALAAEGGKRWTNALVWTGGLAAVKSAKPARAELIEFPAGQENGEATGQWRLELDAGRRLGEGTEFLLAQASTGRVMGAGRAGTEGYLELETGGGFEEIPVADWILLFPEAGV